MRLVAVMRGHEVLAPDGAGPLQAADRLVLAGSDAACEGFLAEFGGPLLGPSD